MGSKATPLTERSARGPRVFLALGMRCGGAVAVWLAVTGGSRAALPVGLAAVFLVVAASLVLAPPARRRPRVMAFLHLGAVVAWRMAGNGFRVARLALVPAPGEPDPGFLSHRLDQPSHDVGLGLATVLTLLPGTAGASTGPEVVEVHALHRPHALDGARDLERILVRASGSGVPGGERGG